MTRFNLPLKAAATFGALTLTAFTAPAAFAGDGAYSKVKDRVVSKVHSQRQDRGARDNRGVRHDRGDRSNRGHYRDRSRSDRSRSDRNRRHNYRSDRGHRNRGYSNHYRPASHMNYRRGHGYRHNGFRSNYRSNLGINFSFGSPGYSSYRWAPSNYGLYRPGRVSHATYRNRTRCERVIVDGFHYGTIRPVSVKQCYNPWDGYYIVQGSERIAHRRW